MQLKVCVWFASQGQWLTRNVSQQALFVKFGLDESWIAVKLHQVANLLLSLYKKFKFGEGSYIGLDKLNSTCTRLCSSP